MASTPVTEELDVNINVFLGFLYSDNSVKVLSPDNGDSVYYGMLNIYRDSVNDPWTIGDGTIYFTPTPSTSQTPPTLETNTNYVGEYLDCSIEWTLDNLNWIANANGVDLTNLISTIDVGSTSPFSIFPSSNEVIFV